MTVETTTFTIESDDGATDDVELPTGLVDALAEDGQTDAETAGDITLLAFVSRAHHLAHHSDEADDALEAQEARAMKLFEERFGLTFEEATGHSH